MSERCEHIVLIHQHLIEGEVLLDHKLTAALLIGIVWHKLLLGKSSQVDMRKRKEL